MYYIFTSFLNIHSPTICFLMFIIYSCECNSCLPCTHIGATIFTTFHKPIDLTGCYSGTRQLLTFR